MAEMVIMVRDLGPDPKFRDCDVFFAFNNKDIWYHHAEVLCSHKMPNADSNGITQNGGRCHDFHEILYKYRFDYLSRWKVKRTDQFTATSETVEDGTDWDLFLIRRKKHLAVTVGKSGKLIFGSSGSEYWFGGNMDVTPDKVSEVWDMIELSGSERRDDDYYSKWPQKKRDMKRFLVIPCDDFNDTQKKDYISSVKSGETIQKARKYKIDWKNLANVSLSTINKILDKSIAIDFRKFSVYPLSVCEVK